MRTNPTIYPFLVCLQFFTYGAHYPMFAANLVNIYGIKYGPLLATFNQFALIYASFLAYILS